MRILHGHGNAVGLSNINHIISISYSLKCHRDDLEIERHGIYLKILQGDTQIEYSWIYLNLLNLIILYFEGVGIFRK